MAQMVQSHVQTQLPGILPHEISVWKIRSWGNCCESENYAKNYFLQMVEVKRHSILFDHFGI